MTKTITNEAMEMLIDRPRADDANDHAVSFVSGVNAGVNKWSEMRSYSHEEWPADGFVYFAVIGEPKITHVKIGFTSSDPAKRVKALQTGCPFKIRILGYVFGSQRRERELQDVLSSKCSIGEWFEYTDWVASVVDEQLSREALL